MNNIPLPKILHLVGTRCFGEEHLSWIIVQHIILQNASFLPPNDSQNYPRPLKPITDQHLRSFDSPLVLVVPQPPSLQAAMSTRKLNLVRRDWKPQHRPIMNGCSFYFNTLLAQSWQHLWPVFTNR